MSEDRPKVVSLHELSPEDQGKAIRHKCTLAANKAWDIVSGYTKPDNPEDPAIVAEQDMAGERISEFQELAARGASLEEFRRLNFKFQLTTDESTRTRIMLSAMADVPITARGGERHKPIISWSQEELDAMPSEDRVYVTQLLTEKLRALHANNPRREGETRDEYISRLKNTKLPEPQDALLSKLRTITARKQLETAELSESQNKARAPETEELDLEPEKEELTADLPRKYFDRLIEPQEPIKKKELGDYTDIEIEGDVEILAEAQAEEEAELAHKKQLAKEKLEEQKRVALLRAQRAAAAMLASQPRPYVTGPLRAPASDTVPAPRLSAFEVVRVPEPERNKRRGFFGRPLAWAMGALAVLGIARPLNEGEGSGQQEPDISGRTRSAAEIKMAKIEPPPLTKNTVQDAPTRAEDLADVKQVERTGLEPEPDTVVIEKGGSVWRAVKKLVNGTPDELNRVFAHPKSVYKMEDGSVVPIFDLMGVHPKDEIHLVCDKDGKPIHVEFKAASGLEPVTFPLELTQQDIEHFDKSPESTNPWPHQLH